MKHFTPADFTTLIEREQRWIELLVSAIHTRRALRDLKVKLLANDTVETSLEQRARWLRN